MSDAIWLAIIAGVVAIATAVIANDRRIIRKRNGIWQESNGRRPVEKVADESYGQIIKSYREDQASLRAELLELRLKLLKIETSAGTLQDQIDTLVLENTALKQTVSDQKDEIARLWMLLGHSAKDAATKADAESKPAPT